jgi:hypothetical protein
MAAFSIDLSTASPGAAGMAAALARFAKRTHEISQGDRREQYGRALLDWSLLWPV